MPLTQLRELVSVLIRKKIPDREIFDAETIERKDPRYQLYLGIKNEKFRTLEEAAHAIYKGKAKDNNFRLILSRLRQQLVDVVVHSSSQKDSSQSEYLRASQEIIRGVFEVRSLIANGALAVGRSQAERLLTMAIKYDMNEQASQLARILRSQSVFQGDRKKFTEYSALCSLHGERAAADIRCEQIIDDVALIFITSADDKPESVTQLEAWSKELRALHKKHPTFIVSLNYFRIHAYTTHARHEHQKSAEHCIEALHYLKEHSHLSSASRVSEFANYALNEYITIGNYADAEQYAQLCFDNCQPYSNQWYAVLSMYFILAMHRADYQQAMDIFRQAATPALHAQTTYHRERWKLYAGYLLYLQGIKRIALADKDVTLLRKEFKREKFSFAFNYDLEVYTKDKTGMWIPILILEFLHTVEIGKISEILSLQEKLRTIYYRLLKPEHYPRANAFFHLLQILMQEQCILPAIRERADEDLSILSPYFLATGTKNRKRHTVTYMEGLEILRYEVLWDIIIQRIAELQAQGKLASSLR